MGSSNWTENFPRSGASNPPDTVRTAFLEYAEAEGAIHMLFMAKMRLAAMVAILLLTAARAATQGAPDQGAPDPGGAAPKSETPKPAPESSARVQVNDLLWSTKTDATGRAKPLQMLGYNGFAVIRNAAEEKVFLDRLGQAKAERRDYSVRAGPTFAKGLKVVCWRDVMQADDLRITGAEQVAGDLRLLLETKRMAAGANGPSWQALCAWIPRSERLEVPAPPAPGKDEIWTADSTWGDVADGLQPCLEVKQTTIKPGDDIALTMSLRNVKPAGDGNSIQVWDNKYSNGYRADFYLVVMPDGQSRILRRPEQDTWLKNMPTPITIQPGKSWTLAGIASDVIVKSLKELGLDTSQKGIYTVTGYYQADGDQGDKADQAHAFWGGQIATPPVEIRVGDGEFKAPAPEKIKAVEER